MNTFEIYALCAERSVSLAQEFLDEFLPARTQNADDYPFPEFSETPIALFTDAATLIEQLEIERSSEYAIYWDSTAGGEPHQAILVFTKDGGMIAGLAFSNEDARSVLGELSKFVRASYGLVVPEERPPSTVAEFMDLCKRSDGIRLVSGKLL